MGELTADAVKLAKLGRVLAEVADGVAFMDNLEDNKIKINKEIAAAQAGLAKLKHEQSVATDAIAAAKKSADAYIQAAKEQAAGIVIKGESEAQDIIREAQDAKGKISDEAEKIAAEIAALKRARDVADAAVKKAKEHEAEILAKIAKAKEDAKRSLGL